MVCHVMFVGDSGVGKTSLVRAAAGLGGPPHLTTPSVIVDTRRVSLPSGALLSLADFPGGETVRSYGRLLYGRADVVCLVYDCGRAAETLHSALHTWLLAEIAPHRTTSTRPVIVVVGTKADTTPEWRGPPCFPMTDPQLEALLDAAERYSGRPVAHLQLSILYAPHMRQLLSVLWEEFTTAWPDSEAYAASVLDDAITFVPPARPPPSCWRRAVEWWGRRRLPK